MLRSTAHVTTTAPARYAKQLVSHLGRKAGVAELADGAYQLSLSAGTGVVRVDESILIMEAIAADDTSLAAVEDVLARHLVRFGARQSLEVSWRRSDVSSPDESPPPATAWAGDAHSADDPPTA